MLRQEQLPSLASFFVSFHILRAQYCTPRSGGVPIEIKHSLHTYIAYGNCCTAVCGTLSHSLSPIATDRRAQANPLQTEAAGAGSPRFPEPPPPPCSAVPPPQPRPPLTASGRRSFLPVRGRTGRRPRRSGPRFFPPETVRGGKVRGWVRNVPNIWNKQNGRE